MHHLTILFVSFRNNVRDYRNKEKEDNLSQGSSSEVFGRGLEILELIAESHHGVTIEQLAEGRGMHRSSVYRYISPLLERFYIVKSPEGRYQLGAKCLELTSLLLGRLDVRNVAHPLLIQLSEKTNATIHLALLEGTDVVYLDKVETQRSLPLVSRIGGRQPAYCTGVGKALLAYTPQARLDEILPRITFEPFTATTIQDMERLAAELAVIRSRGYAMDMEEHEPGISCVAFPILDLYSEPIAAVSATVSARELNGKLDFYIKSVESVAAEVSKAFGYSR